MGDDVTGYVGEKIGEMRDYHDGSGKYLGTGFTEEKGCLEVMLWLFLPITLLLLQIEQPARKVTTEYAPDYTDRRIATRTEETKGCLEMLALLPFMGVMIYYVQILFG